jgi:hypothetical protein
MWRMLPAFWVIGLVAIAFGVPLWLGRVRANPYYGVTIGNEGARDDVWYPVNALLGRDLVFTGLRFIVAASLLATFAWRRPQHYLIVAGCVLVAEMILMAVRWQRIGAAVQKQLGDEPRLAIEAQDEDGA